MAAAPNFWWEPFPPIRPSSPITGQSSVLVDAFIPIVDEVSALIVENGGPSYPPFFDQIGDRIPLPPSISQKEREAAYRRAVDEGLLLYRREVESPAEDILQERKASNPSAVRKLVAFDGPQGDYYRAVLEGIEPQLSVAQPPGVGSIVLRVSDGARGACASFYNGASIAGTDRNMIAIYAGSYRPTLPPHGFYLVYDSSANSLALIPPIPSSSASTFSHRRIGGGAAVLRHTPPSQYLIAELLYLRNSSTAASLFVWKSSAGEWTRMDVVLPFPRRPDPEYVFCADIVFALGDKSICWVDLLWGILVCSKILEECPEFRFIPLPMVDCSCCSWDHLNQDRGRPRDSRYMCSVTDDMIKFIHIDTAGYIGDREITLWTLLVPESRWKKSVSFRIVDMWANTIDKKLCLSKLVPKFPILNQRDGEDGMLYLFAAEENDQYMFGVNVGSVMVVSGLKFPLGSRRFNRIVPIEATTCT